MVGAWRTHHLHRRDLNMSLATLSAIVNDPNVLWMIANTGKLYNPNEASVTNMRNIFNRFAAAGDWYGGASAISGWYWVPQEALGGRTWDYFLQYGPGTLPVSARVSVLGADDVAAIQAGEAALNAHSPSSATIVTTPTGPATTSFGAGSGSAPLTNNPLLPNNTPNPVPAGAISPGANANAHDAAGGSTQSGGQTVWDMAINGNNAPSEQINSLGSGGVDPKLVMYGLVALVALLAISK